MKSGTLVQCSVSYANYRMKMFPLWNLLLSVAKKPTPRRGLFLKSEQDAERGAGLST